MAAWIDRLFTELLDNSDVIKSLGDYYADQAHKNELKADLVAKLEHKFSTLPKPEIVNSFNEKQFVCVIETNPAETAENRHNISVVARTQLNKDFHNMKINAENKYIFADGELLTFPQYEESKLPPPLPLRENRGELTKEQEEFVKAELKRRTQGAPDNLVR